MSIKIYTSPVCPKCKVLKTKMERKGIIFEETTDLEPLAAAGVASLPQLEIDGILMGFSEANNWVDAQGAKI